MNTNEIQEYLILNNLAENNGIIVFGGKEDKNIPVGELKQTFSLPTIYNRSCEDFCLQNSITLYDKVVFPLAPKCLIIHLTNNDFELYKNKPDEFDFLFRKLVSYILMKDKKCKIIIVSFKNFEEDESKSKFNKHLKEIANFEHCEYGDISAKRVWNPQATKDIVSFVYNTGFVHPLKNERPIYDLLKILYFYNSNV